MEITICISSNYNAIIKLISSNTRISNKQFINGQTEAAITHPLEVITNQNIAYIDYHIFDQKIKSTSNPLALE